MSHLLSAVIPSKYYSFINNTIAVAIQNYACVILCGVPLFAYAVGEEDYHASSRIITIANETVLISRLVWLCTILIVLPFQIAGWCKVLF